jgi:hypothetical protein
VEKVVRRGSRKGEYGNKGLGREGGRKQEGGEEWTVEGQYRGSVYYIL